MKQIIDINGQHVDVMQLNIGCVVRRIQKTLKGNILKGMTLNSDYTINSIVHRHFENWTDTSFYFKNDRGNNRQIGSFENWILVSNPVRNYTNNPKQINFKSQISETDRQIKDYISDDNNFLNVLIDEKKRLNSLIQKLDPLIQMYTEKVAKSKKQK